LRVALSIDRTRSWRDDLHIGGYDDQIATGGTGQHRGPLLVVHDRGRRSDIVDDVGEFTLGVGRVHRNHHQAGPQRGDVDRHSRQ